MTFYKNLIIFIILIFSLKAFSCGEYLLHAEVKMKDGGFFLVLYPQTQSEIYLLASFSEAPKLAPYKDRFIETMVTIHKEMEFSKRSISKIDSIKVLVPDPLASGKGTSMKLIKPQDCYRK
jgi:hypothetical protein